MVFDATRKVTYKNLKTWWTELQEYCSDIPTFVAANKIDDDYSITSKSFKVIGLCFLRRPTSEANASAV